VVGRDNGLSEAQFAADVQERREELKNAEDGKINMLRLDQKPGDDATLFRIQNIDETYESEVYLLRGGSSVQIKMEFFHDEYAAAEEDLLKFSQGIQAVDKSAKSSNSETFCLGSVTIRAPPK
jgi:hypothetical protein